MWFTFPLALLFYLIMGPANFQGIMRTMCCIRQCEGNRHATPFDVVASTYGTSWPRPGPIVFRSLPLLVKKVEGALTATADRRLTLASTDPEGERLHAAFKGPMLNESTKMLENASGVSGEDFLFETRGYRKAVEASEARRLLSLLQRQN